MDAASLLILVVTVISIIMFAWIIVCVVLSFWFTEEPSTLETNLLDNSIIP